MFLVHLVEDWAVLLRENALNHFMNEMFNLLRYEYYLVTQVGALQ